MLPGNVGGSTSTSISTGNTTTVHTTVAAPHDNPRPQQTGVVGKRRKTSPSATQGTTKPTTARDMFVKGGGGGRGDGGDAAARRRKRLLTKAVNISPADEDSLKSFLGLLTSVQCAEIFKALPPYSVVGELLAHLLRLLPQAAASLDGAATFIECLQQFEDLEDFVLPAKFYRVILSVKEPPPASRALNWKRKNANERALAGAGGTSSASSLPSRKTSKVTGLQTLREYLCMNGRDNIDSGSRTVVTTLTRALLGSWEGSAIVGRELFDQSVLQNPDRSGPVGLGLEVLLQCLVQDDGLFYLHTEEEDSADGREGSSFEGEDNSDRASDGEDDSDAASSRASCRRSRSHGRSGSRRVVAAQPPSAAAVSPADETRACTTIVGNYVRACGDTSASFFRDIIPKVLLMGMGGGRRGQGGSRRIPRRLAMLLRSLVGSTRSRKSFNVERMVVHTVKEVKGWGDPSVILCLDDDASWLDDDGDVSMGGTQADTARGRKAKANKESTGNDRLRRRGLVLACLDILGPTAPCVSLIRREMVDGENKASLRSAVADGLLEYRRTCGVADADGVEALLLEVLSPLAEDGVLGVRLSAVSATGEGCSSDCVPAVLLLLKRCLDTAPKVRALALSLLVDEVRLGIGASGASLARTALALPSAPGNARRAPDASYGERAGGGSGGSGGSDGGERLRHEGGGTLLLGELLRHHEILEETDSERFPVLLKGLVEAVLRGGESTSTPPRPSTAGSANDGRSGEKSDGDGDGDDGDNARGLGSGRASSSRIIGVPRAAATAAAAAAAVTDPALGYPWCNGGGCITWEGLAAPAARLWAACRPSSPAQLDVLDKVLGDIIFSGSP